MAFAASLALRHVDLCILSISAMRRAAMVRRVCQPGDYQQHIGYVTLFACCSVQWTPASNSDERRSLGHELYRPENGSQVFCQM